MHKGEACKNHFSLSELTYQGSCSGLIAGYMPAQSCSVAHCSMSVHVAHASGSRYLLG